VRRWAIFTALLAGLVAGGVHVLSGPDHLAAVLPLAADSRGERAWWVGLRWGLGHVAGVLLVGALAVALREALPMELISGWSERLVGVLLVGIGVWALLRALHLRLHVHEHVHDGHRHTHLHAHDAAPHAVSHAHPEAHDHGAAAFGVGTLHGLAGSAHLLGVLPALALPLAAAGVYLGAFAVGTLLAMAAFAGGVGLALRHLGARAGAAHRALLAGSGVMAVGVGVAWLVMGPA